MADTAIPVVDWLGLKRALGAGLSTAIRRHYLGFAPGAKVLTSMPTVIPAGFSLGIHVRLSSPGGLSKHSPGS